MMQPKEKIFFLLAAFFIFFLLFFISHLFPHIRLSGLMNKIEVQRYMLWQLFKQVHLSYDFRTNLHTLFWRLYLYSKTCMNSHNTFWAPEF